MTAQLQSPWLTFYDSDGEPLVGAKIRLYEPGTTTPLDAYDDEGATGGDVVSQPFVTNAAGRIPRYYVTQKYRMTVHTSADVLVDDVDDQDPGLPSGFGISATVGVAQGGTGATNAAAARTNLGAASSASVTALQDTITEHDTLIDTGLNVGDPTRFGLLSKEDEVDIDLLATDFGIIKLQQTKDTTPAASTTTTTTPGLDTSTPQISEGTEIFSIVFTPRSASSVIRIRAHLSIQMSGAGLAAIAAIHKSGTTDALVADTGQASDGDYSFQIDMEFDEASGSTAERTYSLRIGTSGGTLRLNGSGGSRTLGSKRLSYLEVIEELTV